MPASTPYRATPSQILSSYRLRAACRFFHLDPLVLATLSLSMLRRTVRTAVMAELRRCHPDTSHPAHGPSSHGALFKRVMPRAQLLLTLSPRALQKALKEHSLPDIPMPWEFTPVPCAWEGYQIVPCSWMGI